MTSVRNQPTSSNPFSQADQDWSVGLFDCSEDLGECVYAYFCSCCFLSGLAKDIGEGTILGCCIPNRVGVYRMKVRSILKIQGSALNDCAVTSCCGFCAALQMKLELKRRGLT